MSPTRRGFLRTAGVAGAGLGLGLGAPAIARVAIGGSRARRAGNESGPRPQQAPSPKRLLILGGTGFIGPHMVRYAVERGHEVTIFTRGRAQADLPDVEHLIGDRNGDLGALEGRSWDVVLDNNTQDYRWAQLSTELLRDAAEQYIFVSSISAYITPGLAYQHKDRVLYEHLINEDSERFAPPEGWQDGDEAHYGLMKAMSEDIVHDAFPGSAAIVRPGLIVGPGDETDRFTYWPLRIFEGGEVLAPGNPEHANQIIDQRDITEWIVRLAENGVAGDFNATGPGARMSMAEMLYGIRAATSAPVEFTWVPEDFLEAQGVRPFGDLPAWAPGADLMYVDIDRALATGLTFRPLAMTSRDTVEWDRTRPEDARSNRRAGMSRQREREVLDAWSAAGA